MGPIKLAPRFGFVTQKIIDLFHCPRCKAKPGEPCRTPKGTIYYTVHGVRQVKRLEELK